MSTHQPFFLWADLLKEAMPTPASTPREATRVYLDAMRVWATPWTTRDSKHLPLVLAVANHPLPPETRVDLLCAVMQHPGGFVSTWYDVSTLPALCRAVATPEDVRRVATAFVLGGGVLLAPGKPHIVWECLKAVARVPGCDPGGLKLRAVLEVVVPPCMHELLDHGDIAAAQGWITWTRAKRPDLFAHIQWVLECYVKAYVRWSPARAAWIGATVRGGTPF